MSVTPDRDLDWGGLLNARDLGGLSLLQGGQTTHGQVVRSDHPSKLTSAGWEALWAYGIRTIVSLETSNLSAARDRLENPPLDIPAEYAGIVHIQAAVQDGSDLDYMAKWADTGLWGTPLFFGDAIHKWPHFYARILSAIADADGGVLVHCGRGHDRTGLVVALMLNVAGVDPSDVADDYLREGMGLAAAAPNIRRDVIAALAEVGVSVVGLVEAASATTDAAYWEDAGLPSASRQRLRQKLGAS
jgi:protein-tyrosine phosphatase